MKKSLALLLAVIMVFSFVACGGNKDEKKFIGTWDIDSYEDAEMVMDKAMLDSYNMKISLVISNDKKVKMSSTMEEDEGDEGTWELVDSNSINIKSTMDDGTEDIQKVTLVGDQLSLPIDEGATMKFKKLK